MIDIWSTTRESLRIDEVMDVLGVSRRAVYYWIASRKVTAQTEFGSARIPVDDVRRVAKTRAAMYRHSLCVQSSQRSA